MKIVKEFVLRVILKFSILLFILIGIYWGHYFYKEIKWKHYMKHQWEEFNSHEISPVTRGGYAHPSHDSIPNTLRPDTLK